MTVLDDILDGVVLQAEEISEHRLAPVGEALSLLSGPVRRRVKAATKATKKPRRLLYLEDGKRVR